MAPKRPPSAIEFTFRVEMQHYSCDVTPVGAFGVRVEQSMARRGSKRCIGSWCCSGPLASPRSTIAAGPPGRHRLEQRFNSKVGPITHWEGLLFHRLMD
jgi:hypothetical protein